MGMDVSEFEDMADETLERLFDVIDAALGDEADVDFDNGILSVELKDSRQYVINKNAPVRQIWVSSPLSGASHYRFDTQSGTWVSTRSTDGLLAVLSGEFSKISVTPVHFE